MPLTRFGGLFWGFKMLWNSRRWGELWRKRQRNYSENWEKNGQQWGRFDVLPIWGPCFSSPRPSFWDFLFCRRLGLRSPCSAFLGVSVSFPRHRNAFSRAAPQYKEAAIAGRELSKRGEDLWNRMRRSRSQLWRRGRHSVNDGFR